MSYVERSDFLNESSDELLDTVLSFSSMSNGTFVYVNEVKGIVIKIADFYSDNYSYCKTHTVRYFVENRRSIKVEIEGEPSFIVA